MTLQYFGLNKSSKAVRCVDTVLVSLFHQFNYKDIWLWAKVSLQINWKVSFPEPAFIFIYFIIQEIKQMKIDLWTEGIKEKKYPHTFSKKVKNVLCWRIVTCQGKKLSRKRVTCITEFILWNRSECTHFGWHADCSYFKTVFGRWKRKIWILWCRCLCFTKLFHGVEICIRKQSTKSLAWVLCACHQASNFFSRKLRLLHYYVITLRASNKYGALIEVWR